MNTPPAPCRLVTALLRDRRGASAILTALSMTVLMGFAGMAVDVGLWYADKRIAQGAADSAAFSGAVDYQLNASTTDATGVADAVTRSYGLINGAGGVTVAVNIPPTSGTHTSTSGAVEVVVTKTEPVYFSSLWLSSASVAARAVAAPGTGGGGGKFCALALNPSTSGTPVNVSGGATISMNACGMQVDGGSTTALMASGGATISGTYVNIVGNYQVSGGATITASKGITTGAASVADPYSGVTVPSPGTCTVTGATYAATTVTLSPGTYCSGMNISGGAKVTLNPGVYIIDGGTFSISGGSTLNGTGVTIVLTGSGSNYATASISGGTVMNLSAPTTGATAGLAFMQSRSAPTSGTDSISGGSSMLITGALYFPNQTLNYSGGSTSGTTCTNLIAYNFNFSGGTTLGNSCSGDGTTPIGGGGGVSLVE